MPPKKVLEYIECAKALHGDKYDYSQVEDNYQSCNDLVPIKCIEHNVIFNQTMMDHGKRGRVGCKECIAEKRRANFADTKEKFIEKAKKAHPDMDFDYSHVVYTNAKTKVKIRCLSHGYFKQTPDEHLRGKSGCKKCSNEARSVNWVIPYEVFETYAEKAHNGRYKYDKNTYTTITTKMTIICPEHGNFDLLPKTHLKGSGCPQCGINGRGKEVKIDKSEWSRRSIIKTENIRKPKPPPNPNKERGRTREEFLADERELGKERFIKRASEYHHDKYDYSHIIYENCYSKMIIICPIHGKFNQTAVEHYRYGCRKCAQRDNGKKRRMTTEQFIRKARKVHGDLYDYSEVEYKTYFDNVYIRCPKHGRFEQIPSNHIHKTMKCGCPTCKSSKGEKTLFDYFRKEGIKFITQKTFDDCRDKGLLKFDFYLPEYNLCVEYDGQQHFEPVEYFGGDIGFEATQRRDQVKDLYCINNDIDMIRIPYYVDDIKASFKKRFKFIQLERRVTELEKIMDRIEMYQSNL